MEEKDLDLKKKGIVEGNKNQGLKLLEFVLLEGMIIQTLEWVMVVDKDHMIRGVIDLDLNLLVVNLL